MDEDMAGLQAAGTATDYATCTECGQVISRKQAHLEPSDLDSPERSEYQEYCPGCYELNQQGERVLVTDTEDSGV